MFFFGCTYVPWIYSWYYFVVSDTWDGIPQLVSTVPLRTGTAVHVIFTFNFLFGETLRSSSQAVVVRKNLDCRENCAVVAVVEYQQAAESMQWSLAERSRFLFPSVLEGGKKGELALTPAQMTTNFQTHLRAAGMEDNRYTMHSFRVGGASSHNMDGTAKNVLMESTWGESPQLKHADT